MLKSILELVKYIIIFRCGFQFSFRGKTQFLAGGLLTILYGLFCSEIVDLNLYFLFYFIWIVAEVLLLFRVKVPRILPFIAGSMLFLGLMDSLAVQFVQLIEELLHWKLRERVTSVIGYLITIIFLVLLLCIRKRNAREQIQIKTRYYVVMLLVAFLNTIILSLVWDDVFLAIFEGSLTRLYVVFLLILCSAYLEIALLYRLALANQVYQEKEKLNEFYLSNQQEQVRYMTKRDAETRQYRHDMRKYLQTMQTLLEQEEYANLNELMQQITEHSQPVLASMSVGNPIVDAVVNQYTYLCREQGIEFQVQGGLPEQCGIDSIDLCTIFANLLQNAYEAAIPSQQKKIELIVRHDENSISVKETNSCVTIPNWKTSKENTLDHGFGIQNMKKSIEKYNGTMTMNVIEQTDENAVEVQLLLMSKKG